MRRKFGIRTFVLLLFSFSSILLISAQPVNAWSGDRPSWDPSLSNCGNPCQWQFNYRNPNQSSGTVTDSSFPTPFSDSSIGLSVENYQYNQLFDLTRDEYRLNILGSANSRLDHTFSTPSYRNEWDLNQCPTSCSDTGMNQLNQGKWYGLGSWNFYFYGIPYNQVFVCSDGYVAFVYSQSATTCPSSGNVPTEAIDSSGNILNIPSAIIAPWWKPQDISRFPGTTAQGHIYTNTNVVNDPSFAQCGNCPVHTFGIDWVHIPIQGGGCNNAGECFPACFPCYSSFGITFDSTGHVYFEYGIMDNSVSLSASGTSNGVIGVEDASGALSTLADPNTSVSSGGFVAAESNMALPPECICNYADPLGWLNDLQLTFHDNTPADGATLNPTGNTGDLYGQNIQTSPPGQCNAATVGSLTISCTLAGQLVEKGVVAGLCVVVAEGCLAVGVGDIAFSTFIGTLSSASFQPTTMVGSQDGKLETPVTGGNSLCSCATDASVFSADVDWQVPHDGNPHSITISFAAELGQPGGNNGFSDTAHTRGGAQVTLTVDSGDFQITSVTPQSSTTVAAGSSIAYNVNLQLNTAASTGNTISLTAQIPSSGTPPTATFSPQAVVLSPGQSGTSTMTISTGIGTPPGTYNATIIGKDATGALRHANTVSFKVVPPDFSIVLSCQSPNCSYSANKKGSQITDPITVTSVNSFSGTVNLAVQYPSGIVATTNPLSVTVSSGGTASASLIITTSSITGTFTVTVYAICSTGTCTSPAQNHSASVKVVVK
jgi:hypothetical protein